MTKKRDSEQVAREIKCKTRRKFSTEEKIRIVLEGLRGEETIAELCRREGIRHVYIKPRSLQLNGKIKGSHRSDQEEYYRLLT